MRSLISENYEVIKNDVRSFGTVRVIEDLEAERQDHFDAFLDEHESRAKARLEGNSLDAEASRQLEWIENARRAPPFKPFKITSFNQALHLEGKARRSTENPSSQRPEALTPAKRISPIEALKKAAADETSLAIDALHQGKASVGKQSRPEVRSQSSPAEAGSVTIPASPLAPSNIEPNSGASAPERRAESLPLPAHVSQSEPTSEASKPVPRKGPRVPKT